MVPNNAVVGSTEHWVTVAAEVATASAKGSSIGRHHWYVQVSIEALGHR